MEKKVIEKLMEQTEECLKEYAKKTEWNPQDVECAKTAVSMYEKLQNIMINKNELEGSSNDEWSMRGGMMSHARGRDAMGRFVSRRAPRYYDYDGSLTSYGERSMMNNPEIDRDSRWNRSMGDEVRSMHSIGDRMVQSLERLYDETDSEYERNQVREMIEAARNKSR